MEPLRLATVFWGFVVLRLVNALAVWTFFNPDEYWQSLEPAHRLVFGYGHLTWEWAAGLRCGVGGRGQGRDKEG